MRKTIGEQIHGISEGRLGEKVIVRTSVRSSMRDTITKAIKNTLKIGSFDPSCDLDDPREKIRGRSESSSSINPQSLSGSNSNLTSRGLPRQPMEPPNCKGYSSLTNLPRHSSLRYPSKTHREVYQFNAASPGQQRFPMSVSFYEPSIGPTMTPNRCLNDDKTPLDNRMEMGRDWMSESSPIIQCVDNESSPRNKGKPRLREGFSLCSSHGGLSDRTNLGNDDYGYGKRIENRDSGLFTSQSCKTLQSSPSLTTLKDFDMSNEYDDPCEFDCKSVISTASTSKIFSGRKRNNQHIREFLHSPVRLRKDRGVNKDALEAGFEVPNRRLSRIAVKGGRSEFDPREFFSSDVASIEYSTPTMQKSYPPQQMNGYIDRSSHQYIPNGSPYRPNQIPSSPPRAQMQTGSPINIRGRTTPPNLSQRRSVPVHPQPSNHSTPHGTPVNKIVIPPQSQRSNQRRDSNFGCIVDRRSSNPSSGNNNSAVVLPTYHAYPTNTNNNTKTVKDHHYTREILVDAQPLNEVLRIENIEQRLRSLELDHSSQLVTATSPNLSIQRFEQIIHDKDDEIANLQNKLRKLITQQELEQRQHSNELGKCKRENNELKDEVHKVNERLLVLEKEYEVCEQYQEQILSLEKQLEKAAEDKFFAEFKAQNLGKEVEEKETRIKELEAELGAMRAEHLSYGQSCSSGSTPIVDELDTATMDGSMMTANETTPLANTESTRRLYKKAHSTLGASPSMSPGPLNDEGSGQFSSSQSYLTASGSQSLIRKSFSNYQIDHGRGNEVTPAITQLIQKQSKYLLDARVLTKALAELANRVENGGSADLTSITQIQALAFDSMSESEAEMLSFHSITMSMDDAQRKLEKQQGKLNGITKDLDDLTKILRNLYSDRIRSLRDREANENDGCRLQ